MKSVATISLSAIHDARRVIANAAIRTPLVRLNVPDAPAEIYLKLENLQPIGSFKIRGAAKSQFRALIKVNKKGSPDEIINTLSLRLPEAKIDLCTVACFAGFQKRRQKAQNIFANSFGPFVLCLADLQYATLR